MNHEPLRDLSGWWSRRIDEKIGWFIGLLMTKLFSAL
jgi:hypothetical protein